MIADSNHPADKYQPDAASNTENELVGRAQQGDRNAYGELVLRHSASVIRVVYRLCGDSQLAEDAAQEAFIQAWLHLPKYQPRTPFRHWLYRIAVNAALSYLRREKHLASDDLDDLHLVDPQAAPEAELVEGERVSQVQQAVMALPPASRAVVVLREYEALSYQEIAHALDIPVGTVMSRLNYARGFLRERLQLCLQEEVSHV